MKDKLIKNICQVFGIKRELLLSKSRKSEIVRARQIGMYLLKNHTSKSWAEIGEVFGKDRTTAMYSNTQINNIMSIYKEIELINKINEIDYLTFFKIEAEKLLNKEDSEDIINIIEDSVYIFRTEKNHMMAVLTVSETQIITNDIINNLDKKGYKIARK